MRILVNLLNMMMGKSMPKIAWMVTDTAHDVPYLVFKEPNKYTYGYKYTSVKKIVYFEFEDEE